MGNTLDASGQATATSARGGREGRKAATIGHPERQPASCSPLSSRTSKGRLERPAIRARGSLAR